MSAVPRAADAHLPEPDYSRPLLQIPGVHRDRILAHLTTLYGPVRASILLRRDRTPDARLLRAQDPGDRSKPTGRLDPAQRFTEQDVVLITYGDLVFQEGKRR